MKSEDDNLRSPAEMDDFLNEGIEKIVSNLMSRSDMSGLIDYVYMYVIDVGRVQCRAYMPLDGDLEDKSKKDAISAAVFQELCAGGFVSSPGGVGYEWSSTERVNKYYNGSYLFEMR